MNRNKLLNLKDRSKNLLNNFKRLISDFNFLKYFDVLNLNERYYDYFDSGIILSDREGIVNIVNSIDINKITFSNIQSLLSNSKLSNFSKYLGGSVDIDKVVDFYKDYEVSCMNDSYLFLVNIDLILAFKDVYVLKDSISDFYCNCIYGYFKDDNILSKNFYENVTSSIDIYSSNGIGDLYEITIIGKLMANYMEENNIEYNKYIMNAFLSLYLYKGIDFDSDDICVPFIFLKRDGKYFIYREIDNLIYDVSQYFDSFISFNVNSPLIPVLSSDGNYLVDSFPDLFLSAHRGEKVNYNKSIFAYVISNVENLDI